MQRKETINWWKTILVVALPFIELWIGSYFNLIHSQNMRVVAAVVLGLAVMIVAISMYKDVLIDNWQVWKHHWLRNLLLAFVSVIGIYVLLAATRALLKTVGLSASGQHGGDMLAMGAGIMVIGSLTSLFAPFTEEIVYRHVMFYQFKNSRLGFWLMFFVQSIAFGLIHWNNFHGVVVQMIPYMVIGAFFGLIYYWSKNIWQSIVTHFIFDFTSFAGAVFVFAMQFFTK